MNIMAGFVIAECMTIMSTEIRLEGDDIEIPIQHFRICRCEIATIIMFLCLTLYSSLLIQLFLNSTITSIFQDLHTYRPPVLTRLT